VDLYSSDSDSGKQLPDLLKRDDISAVIIALPITSQPDYIKQCLSAGKHVLAEKPIAKDIASAQELIKWYHSNIDTKKVNFSIAEQFRYLTRFRLGAKKVTELGRVLGFRLRLCALVEPGGKYISTSWREKPEHQGGFLLDGGVHFVAGIRMMLGSEARMAKVSAFTAQLQEHLPPIDTVNAGVKLRNGASGTVAISFGTTFQGAEWTVACEKGTVEVDRGKVTVKKGGKEDVEECDDENGVNEEVKVWAKSLESGKWDTMQSPEEALADLEVVSSNTSYDRT